MTLNVQFLTLVSMILGGFYLAVMQDTFRRFAIHWKGKPILSYFMEICFWLSQTIILFYVLFRINDGELRLYVFLACLLGFAAYQALAATIYRRLLEHVIQIVLAIYRVIERLVQVLIIVPIKFIIQVLITIIISIVQALFVILLFIVKLVFIPIKWLLLTIYQILPENLRGFFNKLRGFYSIMKNRCIKWLKYIMFNRR